MPVIKGGVNDGNTRRVLCLGDVVATGYSRRAFLPGDGCYRPILGDMVLWLTGRW